jgi:hypothetical protein
MPRFSDDIPPLEELIVTWDAKAGRGEWYWSDPDAPWPKKAPFEKPYEFPPLDLPGV